MIANVRTPSVLVAIVLGLAQAAHADLSAISSLSITPRSQPHLATAISTPVEVDHSASYTALGFAQDGAVPLAAEKPDAPSSSKVIELPPAPSSAALFLSALMSAGAWHVCRSAKHLHVNGLPDWYHAGAPVQIGHVVIYDPNFNSAPLCLFEQPVGERPFAYRAYREHVPRRNTLYSFIIAAPRGPPACPF